MHEPDSPSLMTSKTFRSLAVLFAVLVTVSSVPASHVSLDCSTIALWRERGNPVAFAFDAPYLFAADGRGLSVWDLSDPAAPVLVDTSRTQATSTDVALVDGRIAVLAGSELILYSLSPQRRLSVLNRMSTDAVSIAGSGSWLATVGTSLTLWQLIGSELTAIDMESATQPRDVQFADENRLFLSESGRGISMYEVSGSDLRFVQRISGTAGSEFAVEGDRLYSVFGAVKIFDLNQNPPPLIGYLSSGDVLATALAVQDHILYLFDQKTSIVAWDVTDPDQPVLLNRLDGAGDTLAVAGDLLAASGRLRDRWDNERETPEMFSLFSFDNGLTRVATVGEAGGPLSGVAFDGEFAYVADPPYFHVGDLRLSGAPVRVATFEIGDGSNHVRIRPGMAIAFGAGYVHLFDISDPLQPAYAGIYDSQGVPHGGATFAGDYMIEANRASGFHVLDISNPAQPIQIDGLLNDTYGQWSKLIAHSRTAYGAIGQSTKIIDITNPHAIRVTGVLATASRRDLEIGALSGDPEGLLLLLNVSGLYLFDIRISLEPVLLSSVAIADGIDVAIHGTEAVVVTADRRLLMIDVSDPTTPRIRHEITGFHQPTQADFSGDVIVVADRYMLRVLMDPAVATVPVTGKPELSVLQTTPSHLQLQWTDLAVPVYEVQMSSDGTFTSPTTFRSGAPRIEIPWDREVTVRVRGIRGCQIGPWSSPLTVPFTELDPGRRRGARR